MHVLHITVVHVQHTITGTTPGTHLLQADVLNVTV